MTMIELTNNEYSRFEQDDLIIKTLQRKGWIIKAPKPSAPEYNIQTQKLEYNEQTNSYEIVELTPEEIVVLDSLKNKQLIFDAINNGFIVQPENIVLALGESDRNAFSQMLGLVKEALDLGLISEDTLQTISDKNGEKHQLTTSRFRQVMVAYGFYFKGLWDGLNS